jgi:hypothetical protein
MTLKKNEQKSPVIADEPLSEAETARIMKSDHPTEAEIARVMDAFEKELTEALRQAGFATPSPGLKTLLEGEPVPYSLKPKAAKPTK